MFVCQGTYKSPPAGPDEQWLKQRFCMVFGLDSLGPIPLLLSTKEFRENVMRRPWRGLPADSEAEHQVQSGAVHGGSGIMLWQQWIEHMEYPKCISFSVWHERVRTWTQINVQARHCGKTGFWLDKAGQHQTSNGFLTLPHRSFCLKSKSVPGNRLLIQPELG